MIIQVSLPDCIVLLIDGDYAHRSPVTLPNRCIKLNNVSKRVIAVSTKRYATNVHLLPHISDTQQLANILAKSEDVVCSKGFARILSDVER